jgi:hypothetical protein
VKSNARWEWSVAERVGARDERIDLIMGEPQSGVEEDKKRTVEAQAKGKKGGILLLKAKVYSWIFARARGLLRISLFLLD